MSDKPLSNTTSVKYTPSNHSLTELTTLSLPTIVYNHKKNTPKKQALKAQIKHEKSDIIVGSILVLVTAILFSFVAVCIQWGDNLGFPSLQLMLLRAIVQSILTVFYSFLEFNSPNNNSKNYENLGNESTISKYKINVKFSMKLYKKFKEVKRESYFWVFLRGFTGGSANICYFIGIVHIPLGDAVTTYAIAPIFTCFWGYLFLQERITKIHFLGLCVAMIGIALVSKPKFIFSSSSTSVNEFFAGYLMCLLSAVFGSFTFVAIRKAKTVPHLLLVYSHSMGILITGTFMFLILQLDKTKTNYTSYQDYLVSIFLGLFGFLSQLTLNRGCQMLPSNYSSLIRSSEAVFAYIFEITVFNTTPNYVTIIGAVLMMFAVVSVIVEKIAWANAQSKIMDLEENIKGIKVRKSTNLLDVEITDDIIRATSI